MMCVESWKPEWVHGWVRVGCFVVTREHKGVVYVWQCCMFVWVRLSYRYLRNVGIVPGSVFRVRLMCFVVTG